MFKEIAAISGPVLGGLLGGSGAKDAEAAQAAATAQGIDVLNTQNIQNRVDLAPYRELGTGATKRLSDLLGLKRSTEDYVLPNGVRLGDEVARAYEEQVRRNVREQGNGAYERKFLERNDSDKRTIMDRYMPGVLSQHGVTMEQINAPQAGPSAEEIMAMDPGYQFRLAEGQRGLDRQVGAMGLRNSGAALRAGQRYAQDYASSEFGNVFSRLSGAAGMGQSAATNTAAMGSQNAQTVGGMITGLGNARGAAAIAGSNAIGGALGQVGNYFGQQNTLDKILNRGSSTSGRQSNAELASMYNF